MRRSLAALIIATISSQACAQSSPNISYGQVPTAGQWNAAFAAKQDLLTYTPLSLSGGSMRGKLYTLPSTVNGSGLSLQVGMTPTAPLNGDVWVTGSGLFAQAAGKTLTLPDMSNVSITGGTINGTAIGGTTPAPATFTTATATSFSGPLTGNASTASALQTARTLALSGDVTGSAMFDDSANATIAGTLASSGVSAGTYGSASAIPVLTVDVKGRITSATTAAPASGGAVSPPVRQTVASGPATAGLPTFLPSTTSGTLTLTAQNVTSSAPLIITAAQGFGTTPNVSYSYTSNPTWSGLTTSATNYLYVNASTGTTGFTTLQPIYQFGGTPSTTNGQFTFDYSSGAMQGYLGNGSSAVATPLVFVGEAVTSSTAVTSTVAYAYGGFYDSGWISGIPAASSVVTRSHNLGIKPLQRRTVVENVISEAGYAIGDQVSFSEGVFYTNGTYGVPIQITTDRNALTMLTNTAGPAIYNKATTTVLSPMTSANWRYKFIMQRGW